MSKEWNLIKEIMMNKLEEKKDFTTGIGNGMRYNHGKLRYDLIHPKALEDFIEVLTDGAVKYNDDNWRGGMSWRSVLASLKRHIAAIERGEDYDSESGRLHIAHAACNVHFLNAFYYIFPQGDDRPKNYLHLPKIGLDVDDILANFRDSWGTLYPEIIAMNNSWYFDRNIKEKFEKMRVDGILDAFYLNLKPLIKPEDIPFEPHCYITARPVSKEITEKWLDKYGFPAKKVISLGLNQSKIDAVKENMVEIFIDDCYENFVELNNHGVFTYLYTAPWNQRYNVGHMRLNSLKDLPLLK